MEQKFVPVFCGSAFKNKARANALGRRHRYLPNPDEVVNKALDQRNNEAEII